MAHLIANGDTRTFDLWRGNCDSFLGKAYELLKLDEILDVFFVFIGYSFNLFKKRMTEGLKVLTNMIGGERISLRFIGHYFSSFVGLVFNRV